MENHKAIGFLSNTGPDSLENDEATKTACNVVGSSSHCRTGSPLARTNLSPFARCTLGLSRHFY